MTFIKANLLSFLALAGMILSSLILWGQLPDQVPSHFNFSGEIDDYSARGLIVSILPLTFVAVIVLVNVAIRISPQKFSMPNSKRAMDVIVFGIGIMMLFLHLGMLLHSGEFDVFVRYFSWGMAAFLIITGNVFGKTERNFFIGLRTPWTIASAANWKATHRFMGRLMVGCGILLLATNSVYSKLYVTIALSIAPVLVPVAFSIFYYFRHERQLSEGDSGS